MALINCSECGKEISDKATVCPSCGAPVQRKTETDVSKPTDSNWKLEYLKAQQLKSERDKKRNLMIAGIGVALFVFVIVIVAIFGETEEQKKDNVTPSNTTNSTEKSSQEPSPDESPKDGFQDNVRKALDYRLEVASGKISEVKSLLDDDPLGYHGLNGSLAAYKVNASLSEEDETKQEYRTMYYALNWKDAYVEEFGEDSYMENAIEYISTIISKEEINSVDDYFVSKKEDYIKSIDDYKKNAKTIDYENLIRNPDDYKGKILKVKIKVSQVMGGGDDFIDTLYENGYHGKSGNNEWYIQYDLTEGESRIIEDDTVIFYGEFNGLKKVTRVLGNSDLIPELKAKYRD